MRRLHEPYERDHECDVEMLAVQSQTPLVYDLVPTCFMKTLNPELQTLSPEPPNPQPQTPKPLNPVPGASLAGTPRSINSESLHELGRGKLSTRPVPAGCGSEAVPTLISHETLVYIYI